MVPRRAGPCRQNGGVDDEWGITDGYHDLDGTWHATSDETRARLRSAMGDVGHVPQMWFVEQGTGHDLWGPCRIVVEGGSAADRDLCPPVTRLPHDLPLGYHHLVPVDGGPATQLIVHPSTCPPLPEGWGAAAQIYALWSDRSWGIGDLRDLRRLAQRIVNAGGTALMMSPLHQPAPTLPQEPSPYYPSSRRTRNPMLLGIDAPVPASLRCDPGHLISHDDVWIAKRSVLEAEFDAVEDPPDPSSVSIWNAWCDTLRDDWALWPETLGNGRDDPDLLQRARFHEWLQLTFDEQLAAVAATGISLIGDLAIGFAPNGADAYEYRHMLADGVRIGAPPDPFNAAGQDWGIPPFVPWKLRAAGYQPFIDTLRAAFRGVDGLRIDHVMGLFRQYWIPLAHPVEIAIPRTGAYVRFPAEELLAILCLEATRADAFVIGEDLGTVEPEVRAMLAARNIACTKVLWFEPDPPSQWPTASLATITTHDLPTIATMFARPEGDPERARLTAVAPDASTAQQAIDAAHDALLNSPARLRLLSTDDLAAAVQQPNLPGTNVYPSWRIRLPLSVDELPITPS